MGRFAFFIDAGFLLAWGAARIAGAGAPRHAVNCDHPKVLQALLGASAHAGLGAELLRIYWYDAGKDHQATAEHVAIGNLDDVKIRLGRLMPHGQKGVDTLLVLDLTTLARERAIDTAFLLSGDEDLREGVVVSQQSGVRVVLMRLVDIAGTRQSKDLIQEADRIVDLTAAVEVCFSHVATWPFLDGQAFAQTLVAAPANAGLVGALSALKAAGRPLAIPQAEEQQLDARVRQALAQRAWRRPDPDAWHTQESHRGFWDQIP